jgi:hypothetical protein
MFYVENDFGLTNFFHRAKQMLQFTMCYDSYIYPSLNGIMIQTFIPRLMESCFSSKSYNHDVVNKPLNISFNIIFS